MTYLQAAVLRIEAGVLITRPMFGRKGSDRLEETSSFPPGIALEAMDLQQKIRTLPTQPGVYLYKNAEGEVIYVGKAKNLRARVRSYLL